MLHGNKSHSWCSTCGTLWQTHAKANTNTPNVTAADVLADFTYYIYFAINATASILIVGCSFDFTNSPDRYCLRNGWSIC
jgi:hypothetical protein